ncbi:hypothetical protein QJS04_geneDACA005384 [Acorus gramineus]|uniref:Uncharacterized protein n=1 Tax=Acorus gramineus TaxID=55184 RepID=A0AAV9AXC4_ACOGR|nr:hypothetical protein QJS04_geneDACA005384 [Acorus gramineus]
MADRSNAGLHHHLTIAKPEQNPKDMQGSDSPIPLSPQWLMPKPRENMLGIGNGEAHFSPHPSHVDPVKALGNGEKFHDTERKKDVFNHLSWIWKLDAVIVGMMKKGRPILEFMEIVELRERKSQVIHAGQNAGWIIPLDILLKHVEFHLHEGTSQAIGIMKVIMINDATGNGIHIGDLMIGSERVDVRSGRILVEMVMDLVIKVSFIQLFMERIWTGKGTIILAHGGLTIKIVEEVNLHIIKL